MELLWKTACADPQILKTCSTPQRRYYAIIGFMIWLLGCYTSFIVWHLVTMIAYQHVVHVFTDMLLTVFFTFLVINLYRFSFMLVSSRADYEAWFTNDQWISEAVRFGFLLLVGFLLAEGATLYIFKTSIDMVMDKIASTSGHSSEQLLLRDSLGLSLQEWRYISSNSLLSRIRVLNGLAGWKGTILVFVFTIFFTIPILLRMFLPMLRVGEYELKRADLEDQMIREGWQLTVEHYKGLFKEAIGKELEPFTRYADAPYNTIFKPEEEL